MGIMFDWIDEKKKGGEEVSKTTLSCLNCLCLARIPFSVAW